MPSILKRPDTNERLRANGLLAMQAAETQKDKAAGSAPTNDTKSRLRVYGLKAKAEQEAKYRAQQEAYQSAQDSRARAISHIRQGNEQEGLGVYAKPSRMPAAKNEYTDTATRYGKSHSQPEKKETGTHWWEKTLFPTKLKIQDDDSEFTKYTKTELNRTLGTINYLGNSASAVLPMAYEGAKETVKQFVSDLQSPLGKEYSEAKNNLRNQIHYGVDPEETKKAFSKYAELNKEWDERDKTFISPDSLGMQLQNRASEYYGQALEGTKGADRWLRSQGISIADNALNMVPALANPALAPISLAAMGVKAAASETADLTNRGVPAAEAFGRGLVSGGIEVGTEYLSFGSLLDLIKTGGKSFLFDLAKQIGVEAGEEGTSYIANYIMDKAAKDPNARFSAKDLLSQMGGGALSGAVFGSGGYLIGSSANQQGSETAYSPAEPGTQRPAEIPALMKAAADMQKGNADLFKTGVTVQDGVTGKSALPGTGISHAQQESNAAHAASDRQANFSFFYRNISKSTALGENGKRAAAFLYDGTTDPVEFYKDFARDTAQGKRERKAAFLPPSWRPRRSAARCPPVGGMRRRCPHRDSASLRPGRKVPEFQPHWICIPHHRDCIPR